MKNNLLTLNLLSPRGSTKKRSSVQTVTPIITELGSEVNVTDLAEVRRNLRFEAEALQRMENEGGIPMNPRQEASVVTSHAMSTRIKKLFSAA